MTKELSTIIQYMLKENKNPISEIKEENALYKKYKQYNIPKDRFLEIYKEVGNDVYNLLDKTNPKEMDKLINKIRN